MNINKIKNLIYLFVFVVLLIIIKFFLIDKVFPTIEKDSEIWFTSGLLLIVLGIFVTEKYFTRPLDVIVNCITLFVVLLTLNNVNNFIFYQALFFYLIIISCIACLSFILIDEEKDKNLLSQRIASSSNVISGYLGSSRILFSIVFLLSIISYFVPFLVSNGMINKEQISIISLIIFWCLAILIEPIDKKLITPLIDIIKNKDKPRLVGKISKRLNPNILYAEQFSNSPKLTIGDILVVNDIKNTSRKDIKYIMYLAESESEDKKYLQFYSLDQKDIDISKQNYIFKFEEEIPEEILKNNIFKYKDNIIGFISEGSDIDVIKIKMLNSIDEKKMLKEGDLLSVDFYKNSTKYQIINVETDSENVDGKSKSGAKIITAQQIGYWRENKQKFADTGWTPDLNIPVILENSEEEVPALDGNYFRVGRVPKSKYPIYIDLDECVTHHIAVIGKTGTGKSRMASKIIEKIASIGYKVIIFEVDRKHKQSLTTYIDSNLIEEQDSDTFDLSKVTKNIISINWKISDKDMTTGTLNQSDIAANLIQKIIIFQEKNENEKICIAMEEAYDFIPESTFGDQGFGQKKVSRISQMVLKCRKHNIGFLIITQRTALVTKTILYQCHTIIALQSFDETSRNFMGAYINGRYLESMSILPRFRAIVVGKGSTCDKPVIVDFYDKALAEKKEEIKNDNGNANKTESR